MKGSPRSITELMDRTWFFLGAVTALLYGVVQAIIFHSEYAKKVQLAEDRLSLILQPVATALFREIMDPNLGVLREVMHQQQVLYDLPLLVLAPLSPECESSDFHECVPHWEQFVVQTKKIGSTSLSLGYHKPEIPLLSHLAIPLTLLLTVLLGLAHQRRTLQQSVTSPLEKLSILARSLALHPATELSRSFTVPDCRVREIQHIQQALLQAVADARALNQHLISQQSEQVLTEAAYFVLHDVKNYLRDALDKIQAIADLDPSRLQTVRKILEIPQKLTQDSLEEFKFRRQNQLPGFLTPTSPTLAIHLAPLGCTLRELIAESESLAQKKGIVFRTHLSRIALTRFCHLDSWKLRRVLGNLLDNALTAVEQQTRKEVDMGVHLAGKELEILIKDTGPGLSPQQLQQFQAGEMIYGGLAGSGLGLKVTRALLQAGGGSLDTLRLEQATFFKVNLPLLPSPPWFFNLKEEPFSALALLTTHPRTLTQVQATLQADPRVHPLFRSVTEASELLAFAREQPQSLLLIDADWKGSQDSLSLIASENLKARAVLLVETFPLPPILQQQIHSPDPLRIFPKACLEQG